MIILKRKNKFEKRENRMKVRENIEYARKYFFSSKSKNLKFLLKERFEWMNNYILDEHIGIEIGAGPGFSKFFIKNKNFKISDAGDGEHLDYTYLDAHNTKFSNNTFDFIICTNVIHHLSQPVKFLKEMNRILKQNGKLIIFDHHMSVLFQLILNIMRHENYDFDKNVWDENAHVCDQDDLFDSNAATTNLIFDDKEIFYKNLEKIFLVKKDIITECFIFLNSGGVTSKTFFIPLNNFCLNILHKIDKFLVKFFPNIFGLGRKIVLEKINK